MADKAQYQTQSSACYLKEHGQQTLRRPFPMGNMRGCGFSSPGCIFSILILSPPPFIEPNASLPFQFPAHQTARFQDLDMTGLWPTLEPEPDVATSSRTYPTNPAACSDHESWAAQALGLKKCKVSPYLFQQRKYGFQSRVYKELGSILPRDKIFNSPLRFFHKHRYVP